MYLIEDILVDPKIPNSNFLCDLDKCKGACCTVAGDSGAPLADNEVELLEKSFPAAKKYLSKKHLEYIAENGIWERDADGELATVCIDNRDCVFVYYDGDIAKCSLEKAYNEGQSDFQKPISCHLFPIRVGDYGGPYLYYEKFDVCKPAIKNGNQKKVKMIDMLEEAITRAYGEEKYLLLRQFVEDLENGNACLSNESRDISPSSNN